RRDPLVFAIRKWADEGRGLYQELPTGKDSPSRILPLKYGSVLYLAGYRPAFGVLDATGKRKIFVGPSTLTYENSEGGNYRGARILLSPDGGAVQYYFADDSSKDLTAGRFYIDDRTLKAGADNTGSLQPPITQARDETLNNTFQRDRRKSGSISS